MGVSAGSEASGGGRMDLAVLSSHSKGQLRERPCLIA